MRLRVILNIIILFGFGSDELQSQITVSGSLLNIENNSAVAYATIGVEGRPYGTHSNIDGSFKLDSCKQNDIIQIRHINYEAFSFRIDTFTNNTAIKLSPKNFELEEIIVSPHKTKRKKMGCNKGKSSFSSQVGAEFVVLIENKKYTNTNIFEIVFNIERKTAHRNAVKVHIYESTNGFPGKEIFPENNIIIIDKTIQNSISYKPTNKILLPEQGLFIGYEWLGYIDKKGKILDVNPKDIDFIGPAIRCKNLTNHKLFYRVWNYSWHKTSHNSRPCVEVYLNIQNK